MFKDSKNSVSETLRHSLKTSTFPLCDTNGPIVQCNFWILIVA